MGENLAKLNGVTKERMLVLLDRLHICQSDVLVLLVAGEQLFIQPYKGDYIIAALTTDDDAETSVSVTDAAMGDEKRDTGAKNALFGDDGRRK